LKGGGGAGGAGRIPHLIFPAALCPSHFPIAPHLASNNKLKPPSSQIDTVSAYLVRLDGELRQLSGNLSTLTDKAPGGQSAGLISHMQRRRVYGCWLAPAPTVHMWAPTAAWPQLPAHHHAVLVPHLCVHGSLPKFGCWRLGVDDLQVVAPQL